MKNSFLAFVLFFSVSPVFSQSTVEGVINQYAEVVGVDRCKGLIIVNEPGLFNAGEKVLILQMQGARINESNSESFGDIEEMGSAGLFEKNRILSVNGNEIQLEYTLINEFDETGVVQIVSCPVFEDATVTGEVIALPWDGKKGGVIAFEVTGTLTLEASVDASGQGFRGGPTNTVSSDCSFLTNADDYHYSLGNWRGAPKGEGIAAIIEGKEQGRGAQANGGGGGNDHNSGGGGGANAAAAGGGGKQSVSGFGCDGDYPGESGKPLPLDPDRIFMGGGGGAGHDNNGVGTAGGNGGGIIVISANELFTNGHAIRSNGLAATVAGDGAGGGGAGGTILLDINELSGVLTIELAGGKGGDVNNPSDRCLGPGGGGSGGRFVTNVTGQIDLDLGGAPPGINLAPSSQCNGPSNGASDGQPGLQTPFGGIPGSTIVPQEVAVLAQPVPVSMCEEGQGTFTFELEGNFLNFQWQFNDGSGWQDVLPGPFYSGVNTSVLTLIDPVPDMDGYSFRCLVQGPCNDDILSLPATLMLIPVPQPAFSYSLPVGGIVVFANNSQDADVFLWDFGDGNTSMEENPEHEFAGPGIYNVTLTVLNDCGESTFTETVVVGGLPMADFSADFEGNCAPLTVFFSDESSGTDISSYLWQFEGGDPTQSVSPNPTVVYTEPGLFNVKLTVTNNFGADTLELEDYILIEASPEAAFSFIVDGQDVSFFNNSSGGSSFYWDFGDGQTTNEENPVHTYAAGGIYDVVLTVANQGCGSALSKPVFIDLPNASEEVIPFSNFRIYPNPTARFIRVEAGEPVLKGTTIRLKNVTGQEVFYREFSGGAMRLDLGGLPGGIYLLEMTNGTWQQHFNVMKL